MLGGPGTCRLGYSARVQAEQLRRMGFAFTPYTVDLYHLADETLRFLRTVAGASWGQTFHTLRYLLALIDVVDTVEQETLRLRPLEREPGTVDRLRERTLDAVAALNGPDELHERREGWLSAFRSVRTIERCPLRVALVGDLYTMLEPFFNLDLERALGRLGVHVLRSYWVSDTTRNVVRSSLLRRPGLPRQFEAAQPYLARDIGGFARRTVGEAALFAQEGVDGLIHLAPFNCAPEVMAHNVLLTLQRERQIPLLSLSFDEHTGRAGLLTRLEAYVDLLERRRQRYGERPATPSWRGWMSAPQSGLGGKREERA